MDNDIVIQLKKGGDKALAGSLASKIAAPITDESSDKLSVVFDSKGVSLTGYGLTYQGDFESMLHRVTDGRLQHEMLSRCVKLSEGNRKAVDATAGLGEDAFIIAANGYDITLCERNPIIAVLLKDSIRRAKKHPLLKEAALRMHVHEGDSLLLLNNYLDDLDLVYLDPMFPARTKSGLIGKKLQLIQKLEPPCSTEEELFSAALASGAKKIIVKRPLKCPNLAGKVPNYTISGKAIRFDCY